MTDADDDGRADNVGSSMVVVKAADSDGPSSPVGAAGDDFDVEVMYHPLGVIGDVTLASADSSVVVGDADDDGMVPVTVSDTTTGTIAKVNVAVTREVYQQLINYSLDDGTGLAYNIDGDNGTEPMADLVIKAGSSASDAGFTIVVNEEGRSANRSMLKVSVSVASGNMAPVFDDSALDTATAGVTILEFMADQAVTSSGLPIDFGANASDSDNQVLSYSIYPMNKGLKIDSATGMVSIDDGTGVAQSANSNGVQYTVTVSDGTLSDTYSFTAAIATNKPRANGDLDNVTVTGSGTATATITVGDPVKVPQDGRDEMVVDLTSLLHPVYDASKVKPTFVGPTISPFALDGLVLQLASVPDARPDYVLEYDDVVIQLDDGY